MCVREGEEGGGGEQRERIETKKHAHTLCDDKWRPILPISGSRDL